MTKIATDIEQSKVLKNILSLDSHDMYYEAKNGDLDSEFNLFVGQDIAILKNLFSYRFGYTIPAWSLNALFNVMPPIQELCSSTDHYYRVHCMNLFSEWHDNAIDSCVEMIIRLHEKELL